MLIYSSSKKFVYDNMFKKYTKKIRLLQRLQIEPLFRFITVQTMVSQWFNTQWATVGTLMCFDQGNIISMFIIKILEF